MTHRMTWYLVMAATALLLHAGSAQALPGFDTAVVEQYATADEPRELRHLPQRFQPRRHLTQPVRTGRQRSVVGIYVAQALTDVQSLDSDGDGTSNIDEINTDAGFFPAGLARPTRARSMLRATWRTSSILSTQRVTSHDDVDCDEHHGDGDVNVDEHVDDGAGRSHVFAAGDHGAQAAAMDCLYILQAAVHTVTCSPECICAPTRTLPIKATDALLCLNVTVGIVFPLDCPCGGGTSTTVTSSTVTSMMVTSTTETSTTVTSTSSTTEDSTTTTSTLP